MPAEQSTVIESPERGSGWIRGVRHVDGGIDNGSSLSEVRFEQQELGNPPYGCDLGPIDFVAFAKACGADGFRCATPAEVRPALTTALQSPKTAIVEAVVDPDEPPAKPEEIRA